MKIALTSDLHRGYSIETHQILDTFFTKLAAEDCDVVIFAGDLGTSKFEHFKELLRQARRHLSYTDIVAVRGNHDLWVKYFPYGNDRMDSHFQVSEQNIRGLLAKGTEMFKRFNIHHLESGPWSNNNVTIVGWDGWYYLPPSTNDEKHLPGGAWDHDFLTRRAHKQFERVLNELEIVPKEHKKIVVTHMPCFEHDDVTHHWNANPLYMSFLEGKCDILCFGHTHKAMDGTINGIRVLNSGPDYDKPNYIIFEV